VSVAKQFAKRFLARGLTRTGCWTALLDTWARRDTSVVLTYHRVLEKWEPTLDYSQPGMVVTAPTFERQLAFLQRHFEIVPLGTLLEGPASGRRAGRPRCVVTFDDGWRDNYDFALPILRRRGVPATIFLTTDFIGTERAFWHTELIALLLLDDLSQFLREGAVLAGYPVAVREGLRRCATPVRESHATDIDDLIETLKASCDEDQIHGLVDALAGIARLRRPLFPGRRFFLDWDQVREMAAVGFEIGSHGCSHRIMTRLSIAEARRELADSKAEIERRVGCAITHFAFPNENATGVLLDLAAGAGYRTACVGDDVGTSPNIRALRRAGIHEGVSFAGPAYDDALLGLALLRAPKSRMA
jgi:peptidoglycan/xylan/chitin deacetylase (PgdA/CDA1 family)